MLTDEQIQQNADKFLDLLDSVKREGADIEGLEDFLCNSDFFVAPASTKYHSNFRGGLCLHCLTVYKNLKRLVKGFASHKEPNPDYIPANENDEAEGEEFIIVPNYSDDTLILLALLHDISKANYYEDYVKNINTGKKDDKGKDIWLKEIQFKVKESNQRMLMKDHEVNSYILISKYIPLTDEEIAAIMNHHGGWGLDLIKAGEVSAIYEKYTLAFLLHMADMVSVYINERDESKYLNE